MATIVDVMNQYLALTQEKSRRSPEDSDTQARRNRKRKPAPAKDASAPDPVLLHKPPDRETPTTRSYRNALQAFGNALLAAGIDPRAAEIGEIREDWIKHLIADYRRRSKSAPRMYLAAVSKFYHHLAAENLAEVNLARVKQILADRVRKPRRKKKEFPREEIEQLIAYAETLPSREVEAAAAGLKTEAGRQAALDRERLRNLRDRAFILVLADSGLRCSEACGLRRKDIDKRNERLTVTGKGGDETTVRTSARALAAIRAYLALRDQVHPPEDPRAMDDQFVFTRHDRAGRKADRGISAGSGWEIVRGRAKEALEPDAVELIHPHAFRHYFITIAILATNNIEKARRLARHKSITTTQLYAELDDELDRDYDDIFNQRQGKKTGSAQ